MSDILNGILSDVAQTLQSFLLDHLFFKGGGGAYARPGPVVGYSLEEKAVQREGFGFFRVRRQVVGFR